MREQFSQYFYLSSSDDQNNGRFQVRLFESKKSIAQVLLTNVRIRADRINALTKGLIPFELDDSDDYDQYNTIRVIELNFPIDLFWRFYSSKQKFPLNASKVNDSDSVSLSSQKSNETKVSNEFGAEVVVEGVKLRFQCIDEVKNDDIRDENIDLSESGSFSSATYISSSIVYWTSGIMSRILSGVEVSIMDLDVTIAFDSMKEYISECVLSFQIERLTVLNAEIKDEVKSYRNYAAGKIIRLENLDLNFCKVEKGHNFFDNNYRELLSLPILCPLSQIEIEFQLNDHSSNIQLSITEDDVILNFGAIQQFLSFANLSNIYQKTSTSNLNDSSGIILMLQIKIFSMCILFFEDYSVSNHDQSYSVLTELKHYFFCKCNEEKYFVRCVLCPYHLHLYI